MLIFKSLKTDGAVWWLQELLGDCRVCLVTVLVCLVTASPIPLLRLHFLVLKKRKALFLCQTWTRAIYKAIYDSKKTCLNNFFFFLSAQNYKFYCMEPEPSGADPIWSEPEPLKKVAAPLRGGYRGEAKLAQWGVPSAISFSQTKLN